MTVTPVFEADPTWLILALFALSAAVGAYGLWLVLVELYWCFVEEILGRYDRWRDQHGQADHRT